MSKAQKWSAFRTINAEICIRPRGAVAHSLDDLLSICDTYARGSIAGTLKDLIALLNRWKMVSSMEDKDVPGRIYRRD